MRGTDLRQPTPWETPGIWLRLHVPESGRRDFGGLQAYQWAGLACSLLLSWLAAKLSLGALGAMGGWILWYSGWNLTTSYIHCKLRPLTWVCTCWLCFQFPVWLDLPLVWLDAIMPARTFLMAGLIGWLGFRLIDLVMAIYTNSELIRPHRNLSDMIVPVSMRLLKTAVALVVLGYVVYHVGHGQSLVHFMTGLGAAGLAASLAAQDILKSFFGTLLLIGERSFKLGDYIKVEGHEGTVEQVGFRSTRLRTADGSLVTIPNATITTASISNQGADSLGRHSITLALGKEMPVDQIMSLRDRLDAWLQANPAIKADETDVAIALNREVGTELRVSFVLREGQDTDKADVCQEINYGVLRMVQMAQATPDPLPYRPTVRMAG
jgi:MscS family membrane protein